MSFFKKLPEEIRAIISQRIHLMQREMQQGEDYHSYILRMLQDHRSISDEQIQQEYEEIQAAVKTSTKRIDDMMNDGRAQLQESICQMPDAAKRDTITAMSDAISHYLQQVKSGKQVFSPEMEQLMQVLQYDGQALRGLDHATTEQLNEALLECYKLYGLCVAAQSVEFMGNELPQELDSEYMATVNDEEIIYQREIALVAILSMQRREQLPENLQHATIQQLCDYVCVSNELGAICEQIGAKRDLKDLLWGLAFIGLAICMLVVSNQLVMAGELSVQHLLYLMSGYIHPIDALIAKDVAIATHSHLVDIGTILLFGIGLRKVYRYCFPAGFFETRLGVKLRDFGHTLIELPEQLYSTITKSIARHIAQMEQAENETVQDEEEQTFDEDDMILE